MAFIISKQYWHNFCFISRNEFSIIANMKFEKQRMSVTPYDNVGFAFGFLSSLKFYENCIGKEWLYSEWSNT